MNVADTDTSDALFAAERTAERLRAEPAAMAASVSIKDILHRIGDAGRDAVRAAMRAAVEVRPLVDGEFNYSDIREVSPVGPAAAAVSPAEAAALAATRDDAAEVYILRGELQLSDPAKAEAPRMVVVHRAGRLAFRATCSLGREEASVYDVDAVRRALLAIADGETA